MKSSNVCVVVSQIVFISMVLEQWSSRFKWPS